MDEYNATTDRGGCLRDESDVRHAGTRYVGSDVVGLAIIVDAIALSRAMPRAGGRIGMLNRANSGELVILPRVYLELEEVQGSSI